MVRGLKRLGIALPFGWGLTAVPAGGCIRGTKYGTPGAGALWRALVATMVGYSARRCARLIDTKDGLAVLRWSLRRYLYILESFYYFTQHPSGARSECGGLRMNQHAKLSRYSEKGACAVSIEDGRYNSSSDNDIRMGI